MNTKLTTLTLFLILTFGKQVFSQQSSEIEQCVQFLQMYSMYYENTPALIDSLGKLSQDQVIQCEKELEQIIGINVSDTTLHKYHTLRDSLDKTVSRIIDIAVQVNGLDSLLKMYEVKIHDLQNADTTLLHSVWKKAFNTRNKIIYSLSIYFEKTFPPIGDSLDLQNKRCPRYKFTGIKL